MINGLYTDGNLKNVGIRLSGGADSSILYYAICDYYKDFETNIFPITTSTVNKPWYIDAASRIIEIVGNLTGKYPKKHYTHFETNQDDDPGSQYVDIQIDLQKQVIEKEHIELIYNGLTKNPNPDIMDNYIRENAELFGIDYYQSKAHMIRRDTGRDPNGCIFETFNKENEVMFNTPFKNNDKRTVSEAYVNYGMMEKLYPYTFSCESIDDYQNINTVEHCRHCFFCSERYYGFGRII